jgi:hypothetical protein
VASNDGASVFDNIPSWEMWTIAIHVHGDGVAAYHLSATTT